jgi:hypothetical protein
MSLVICSPALMSLATRTMSVFFEMPELKSGVTAKQMKSDSAMQITPRTVLFLKKLIV